MENQENELNLTEEQRKELDKVISQSRKNILWATLKFVGGLLGLNILSFFVMVIFLLDSSMETQKGFMFTTQILNAVLMYSYFYGLLKANSQMADEKIKEIIKKTE